VLEEDHEEADITKSNDMLQCIICEDWYHQKHLKIYVRKILKIKIIYY
jgi:hypothetical protein